MPWNHYQKVYDIKLVLTIFVSSYNDRNNDEGGNDIICYYLLNQTKLFQIPDRTKANIEVSP